MGYNTFEELPVWQEAYKLALKIYKLTKDTKDYALRDQMRRSAISISSNIAEGFERSSSKEFVQFLFIAKGSTGELRSQIRLANGIGYINKKTFDVIVTKCESISRQIMGFISDIRKRNKNSK